LTPPPIYFFSEKSYKYQSSTPKLNLTFLHQTIPYQLITMTSTNLRVIANARKVRIPLSNFFFFSRTMLQYPQRQP